MNTPNYKESTVSGEQWTRASQVHIQNTFGQTPQIVFTETQVTNIGDRILQEQVGSLVCSFDATKPSHLELYERLNAIYVELREARDAAATPPPA